MNKICQWAMPLVLLLTIGLATGQESLNAQPGCLDGIGQIFLTNPNLYQVTANVTGPGFEQQLVVPNISTITGLADAVYLVKTLGNNTEEVSAQNVTVECAESEAVTLLTCENEDGKLAVNNPNAECINAGIQGPSNYSNTLQGNEKQNITGLLDGVYSITTTACGNQSDVIGAHDVNVSCDVDEGLIEPLLNLACENNDGRLNVTNLNNESVSVIVKGADFNQNITLLANEQSSLTGLADGVYNLSTYEIENDGVLISSQQISVSCDVIGEASLELVVLSIGNCTASYECRATGFTPEAYDWDFGDGTNVFDVLSSLESHTYNQTNTYVASCTAWDAETGTTLIAFEDAYVKCDQCPTCPTCPPGKKCLDKHAKDCKDFKKTDLEDRWKHKWDNTCLDNECDNKDWDKRDGQKWDGDKKANLDSPKWDSHKWQSGKWDLKDKDDDWNDKDDSWGKKDKKCFDGKCTDATIFIKEGWPQDGSYVFICDEFKDFVPLAYIWDFGDGTSLAGPNEVLHEYAPGSYTVKCVGSDAVHAAFGKRVISVD